MKRKLQVKRETLRRLEDAQIAGGLGTTTIDLGTTLLSPCPLTLYSICFDCWTTISG